MYAPGTRRHIQTALKLGATVEEIMEVFKICVASGMQASNLGIPILAEELERRGIGCGAPLAGFRQDRPLDRFSAMASKHVGTGIGLAKNAADLPPRRPGGHRIVMRGEHR